MTENENSSNEKKGAFKEIGELIDKLAKNRDSSSKERWKYLIQLFWGVVLFVAFVGSSMIIKWIGFQGLIPQIIRVILETVGASVLIAIVLKGAIVFLIRMWKDLKDNYNESKKKGNSK